jgi:hypothetical protein
MKVSIIVRELAEAIIAARDVSLARHRLLLELLRLLPLYNEIGNLAIWDRAYNDACSKEGDTSETGRLIAELYGFATVTFYGAFQADVQMSEYESICKSFRGVGIACPAVDEFVDI